MSENKKTVKKNDKNPHIQYADDYKELFVDGGKGIFIAATDGQPIMKFGLYSDNVLARDGQNPELVRTMRVNIVTTIPVAKKIAKWILDAAEEHGQAKKK